MAERKAPRVPRERNCDIPGSGHSIPSGTRAMAPASAQGFEGRVRWLSNETFRVAFNREYRVWRHHNPERLKAILADQHITRIVVKPTYELLVIYLEGVKLPYRFYMSGEPLEDCALGKSVWEPNRRR